MRPSHLSDLHRLWLIVIGTIYAFSQCPLRHRLCDFSGVTSRIFRWMRTRPECVSTLSTKWPHQASGSFLLFRTYTVPSCHLLRARRNRLPWPDDFCGERAACESASCRVSTQSRSSVTGEISSEESSFLRQRKPIAQGTPLCYAFSPAKPPHAPKLKQGLRGSTDRLSEPQCCYPRMRALCWRVPLHTVVAI